ncbi:hypothetical protein A9P82_02315 [Arachidicoccus ginsenosidimutans]|nr:hypothetical protein A9P82_02315 [Arachidicoccus sp. BS20]
MMILFCCFSACTTIKNAPADKPFVYESKIELNKDNISKDDAKLLSTNLGNYWVDSLRVPLVTKYLVKNVIISPPVLDTANILKTEKYMNSYLNSVGYYRSTFTDSVSIDSTSKPAQKRATVIVQVEPNKPTIIDSLGYNLSDTTLQKVALATKHRAKIIPGKTKFAQDAVAAELDRLVALYRNMGYYQLTRNNLIAQADTIDANLLRPTLDPFEQAVKMAQVAAKQKENPTVSLTVMKRTGEDTLLVSSKLSDFVRYKIRKVNFYPETRPNEIPDTILQHPDNFTNIHSIRHGDITIYNRENKFVPRPMLEHLYFKKGDLYKDSTFFKTINNLTSIGAWQQVDYRNFTNGDSIDVNYFLVPAIKQNITTELEGSWNTGDFISSSNMFGIALNLSYRNRNVWRRAIQSVTNVLGGVELGLGNNSISNNLIQTLQLGASQSYSFPRFITPFFRIRDKNLDAVSTVLNVSANYTDRRDYYKLRSLVGNWGYQWRNGRSNWQYRPLNIEVYSLDTLSGLDTAIKYNPYLTKAFNAGTVISQQLNFNVSFDNTRFQGNSYLRFAVEEAGGLFGLIKPLSDQIYRYIRVEGEYIKHLDFPKTEFAFRAFAGAGYNYGNFTKFGNTLPFFKQFVAGGPNSMRAWGLRQLGIGSYVPNDSASTFTDRYADMQLEVNLEYRYPLISTESVKINGALFSDIGNIWDIRKDPNLPGAQFDISRLGKDIAIALGTGIRLDFNYFVIRLDFGLKLKDPARLENNGWLSIKNFRWRDYAYSNHQANPITGTKYRNNYGIQLGIGLPF